MKRSLLYLIPALALFLMACPQKHTTSSATPPAPDPNGYQNAQQVNVGTNDAADEPMPGGGYSNSSNTTNTSNTSNSTGGTATSGSAATGNSSSGMSNGNVTNPDSLVVVGSKPDSIRTRLVVSFISTGGGIDYAAQTNLDKWLSKHPDIKYAQRQWGREGEVDYCFITLGTNADAQNKSVSEIKTLIGTNPKVLLKENTVCSHKHELSVVTMPVTEEAIDVPKSANGNTTRLVVSFLSPGDGIDQVGHANLVKYLSKHPEVKYTKSPEGREGELTYCFHLDGRSSTEQAVIVNEIRTAVGTNSKTFISENKICTHTHKHIESADENTTKAPDAPQVDSSNIARVVVSFISIGQGADFATKEKLRKWLEEQNLEYEEKNWGREGETNFCIPLKNKTTRQQDIIVRDLRTFIGTNELVIVQEWGKCDKRK